MFAAIRQARPHLAIATSMLLMLAAIATPARGAAGRTRNGNVAWSFAFDPDPSQSGTIGVQLVNPRTAKAKDVKTCDYSFDNNKTCNTWSSVNFSPGGDRVLWVTGPGVGSLTSGPQTITVMNADFSAPVTINHPGESDTQARFSPDGTRIVYVRSVHGHSDIVTSDLTGGNVRVIGGLPSHAGTPELFPGSRRILFTHNTTIWSARTNGQNARPLIPNGTAPDISPNGQTIAYIGVKSGAVYVANADGTRRRKVLLKGPLCRPPACSGSAEAVVFSPDGATLAFAMNSDPSGSGNPTVYTVSADGGRIKQIASVFTDDAGGATTGLSWRNLP